jgi:glycosyltransferase involved in cell wall biosynthesis/predicted HAD superfamily hydrolase
MPKVSVIIPVYNTAPYLRRCLDSVIGQTLRDIEIICVNDGSTDESGEILRKYAARDERIRRIDSNENKGASIARNTGVDAAQGEYLGFVDSDDWVDLDFYEKLYIKALESEADIVKGNMIYFDYDGTATIKNINYKIKCNRMSFQWQFTTAIYRRAYITAHMICFPNSIYVGEDADFLVKSVYYSNKIEIIDYTYYNYMRNISSVDSRILSTEKVTSLIHARLIILDFINSIKIDRDGYCITFNHLIDDIFALIHKNFAFDCKSAIANCLIRMYSACKYKELISYYDIKYITEFLENKDEHSLILYLERCSFMKSVLISIVIPVYNVEHYLAQCLDSVIGQTYFNLEIICIDDKSTDSSGMILREYEKKDGRIKIIYHEMNRGLSTARNTGIKQAQGEYICFIDSDDWIDADYIERMAAAVQESGADVVRNVNVVEYLDGNERSKPMSSIDKDGFYDCTNFLLYYAWTYLLKKSFIDANYPIFPDGLMYEDNYMYFIIIRKLRNIWLFNGGTYHYRIRRDSITHGGKKINNFDIIIINRLIYTYYKTNGLLLKWGVPIDKTFCCAHMENNIKPKEFFEKLRVFFTEIEHDVRLLRDTYQPSEIEFIDRVLKSTNYARYLMNKHGINRKALNKSLEAPLEENLGVAKQKIDFVEVVSFDIFDTMLLRPFMQPTDVFLYIEKMTGEFGFHAARIKAEHIARTKKAKLHPEIEDITLDEIYSEIGKPFKYLKHKELDTEERTLLLNQEMLELFRYALSRNKCVIVVSDMYLPKDFLSNILEQKGFRGYFKLYISSDIGKTKSSGALYRYVTDDLAISAEKILHIGDNIDTDIVKSGDCGFKTFYYEKLATKFLRLPEHKAFKSYYSRYSNSLTASVCLSLIAIKWLTKYRDGDYWQWLGYSLGGPLAYSFSKAVAEIAKAKKLTDILFVARDGYILNRIFPVIKGNCTAKEHYMYASRKLRYRCIAKIDCERELNCLLQLYFPEYISKGIVNDKIFYKDNIDSIISKIEKTRYEYSIYLNSLPFAGKRIGIVDSIALNFSAQRLIIEFLKDRYVFGIYINTSVNKDYDYIALNNCTNENDFKWNIIELLLSSTEYPIDGIVNCRPVYRNDVNANEQLRTEVYSKIYNSEIEFAKDAADIFGDAGLDLTVREVIKMISTFMNSLSPRDVEYLGKIYCSEDVNQRRYTPLLSNDICKSANKNTIFDMLRYRIKEREN